MKKVFLLFAMCFLLMSAKAQEIIPLWPKGKMVNTKHLEIKDSISNERLVGVGVPKIHAFFTSVQENTGAAVLIIPGGGYRHLAYNISGYQLAKWFNTLGINAFVLDHRLPHSPDLQEREKGPLQDAQRALRIIRGNARKWGIDPNRIGVMGSSAGGHLAASLGTLKDDFSVIQDEYDQYNIRPDFMILVSPVIDMGEYAHKGSRENLLGNNPSQSLVEKYSLQLQVTEDTPPAFIVLASNDRSVSPKNSLMFYEALLDNKIPSSLHLFTQGGHAIALRNNPGSTNLWTSVCEEWLMESNIISKVK
jgi:acetyl esterase/lipase